MENDQKQANRSSTTGSKTNRPNDRKRRRRKAQNSPKSTASKPKKNSAIRATAKSKATTTAPSTSTPLTPFQRIQNNMATGQLDNVGEEINDNVDLTLNWVQPHTPVAIEAEEGVLPLLLRYAKKERGMMNRHQHRIQAIRKACKKYSIHIDQALSMRRTHMMFLNPHLNVPRLNLGTFEDVHASALLFEQAIAQYLTHQSIPFFTEEQQKAMVRKDRKTPPTPDFLLKSTACLSHHNNQSSRPIKWIEAKMFYGASTIPDGSKNAVGGLLRIVRRYVQTYGPGAFVFSFGFGIRIKQMLEAEGAVVLDARPLDLTLMKEHQLTWCANDRGQILP